jgi:hypothetical protein
MKKEDFLQHGFDGDIEYIFGCFDFTLLLEFQSHRINNKEADP